jgi:hypothetical protein
MQLAGIDFAQEYEMPIYYRDKQIGTRRVNLITDISDVNKI